VLAKVSEKYKEEIKNLQKKKIRLEILISTGQYEKVRQIVEEVTNSLSKRKDLLKLAISSVIESIIRNPDKYSFLVSSSVYNGGQHAASQSYIDVYRTLILDDAEKLLEIMVQDLTSNIINQAAWTVHPQTT
jgi:adenine-specific DNA methylase